jgi:hypothetical protein
MMRETGNKVFAVSFFDSLRLGLHLDSLYVTHKRAFHSAVRVLLAYMSHYRPYNRDERSKLQIQGVKSVLFELRSRMVEPKAKVL